MLKDFIFKLEAISQWIRPFDISGPVSKLASVPIDESLSDFDSIVLKSMGSPDERFFTPGDNNRKFVHPLATSMSGMSATFTDSVQREGVGTEGSDSRLA